MESFRPRDALLMGAGQALALQPGVSRSGVTMTVGRFIGFNRQATARISFLMAIVITAGAVVFKIKDVGTIPSDFYAPFLWGIVASAVTGWFAVWATLRIVSTYSFMPFVVYRIVARRVGALPAGLVVPLSGAALTAARPPSERGGRR